MEHSGDATPLTLPIPSAAQRLQQYASGKALSEVELGSPIGGGRVRASSMSWLQAGAIVYAFAAPSAVMAVPYAIGASGFIGGLLISVIITTASVIGGFMLLQVKLQFPECHTFGDLGFKVLGRTGQIWGNIIQLGNFCLFMPCALQFCAEALAGIGKGIPGFNNCSDYYVLVLAMVCLMTTQVRTFNNTKILSCLSIVCVFAMAVIMVMAAFSYDSTNKIPAQLFGNPEQDATVRFVTAAGGFTINAWAFVPAFLTVELSTCMDDPRDFQKSLVFAGILNVLVFVVVGTIVVWRWGYNVGEVIGLTSGVTAWAPGASTNTAFNTFQLIGNFISYMLDSVPLGRYCQRTWAPNFQDTWLPRDVCRYFGYTLPTFLFALFVSLAVPSVNILLDFTTALTTPWVTQIYPAVIYYKLCQMNAGSLQQDLSCGFGFQKKLAIAVVFVIGCISFIICSVKAVGYVAVSELRPPLEIGCSGWIIWKG